MAILAMNLPEGCPECGRTDTISIVYIMPDAFRKRCSCRPDKTWLEERAPELLTAGGWVNNKALGNHR